MQGRLYPLILVIILIIGGCSLSAGQNGAEVYGIRCATCHGADGGGKTTASEKLNGIPDLRSKAVQSKTDAQLFDSIGRGTEHKKYPHVFFQRGVTQGQVSEIVAHLRKLAKSNVP